MIDSNSLHGSGHSIPVTDGDFAGWEYLPKEPFDNHVGPFYHRPLSDGRVLCSFRAEEKNTNGIGLVHGGCLLTLADYCIFVTSLSKSSGCDVVTVSLASEFVGSAQAGDLIEACGEIIQSGSSLIFVRGLMKAGQKNILNFSGTVKILRPRKD